MANLIVSAVCNLRCAYCFAREAQPASGAAFISLSDFDARLDFLNRSGVSETRLIGGEPTLHPQFPELVRRALARGRHLVVFSHGLIPAPALEALASVPAEACTVLVNMNAARGPAGPSEAEQRQRRATLVKLGPRALPGWTIAAPSFRLDDLLPEILETGCRPVLRVGLAQPVLGGANRWLHPKQYPGVGARLAAFARRAAEAGIRLELDCGFVRCMFTDAELQTLTQAQTDFGWRCSPVLDIDLDGRARHCFPLGNFAHVALSDAGQASGLREALARQTRPHRLAGVYKECSACPFKLSGECPGGCLAATLRRFRDAPIRLTVPANPLATPLASPQEIL